MKKTHIFSVIGIALFLLAGVARTVEYYIEPPLHADSVLFMGLIITWGISISYRIVDKRIRTLLGLSSALMLLWILLREIKYVSFSFYDTAARYLWYSYYLPLIFVPLLMFFAALSVKSEGSRRPPDALYLLFIPAALLFIGVMTNDIHGCAFVFREDLGNWSFDYSYGSLYYLVVAWTLLLATATLSILLRKCAVSRAKRRIWIPLLFLFIGIGFVIAYAATLGYRGLRVLQMPEIFCFSFISFWESCIETGLVPTNSGYSDFLNASTINAVIADSEGNIRYSAKNAVGLDKESLSSAYDGMITEGDLRLRLKDITGGRVYWAEDISEISRLNSELEEVKTQISEYNIVLQSEAELKRRRSSIATRNRLYKDIIYKVSPELNRIEQIISELTDYAPDIAERFAEACVLNVYIKRISNLMLLRGDSDRISSFELESSIRETVEYLNVLKIKSSFVRSINDSFSADELIFAYEFFEHIIEQSLHRATALLVNLSVTNERLVLKITCDAVPLSVTDKAILEAVAARSGKLSESVEDNESFISLTLYPGGELK